MEPSLKQTFLTAAIVTGYSWINMSFCNDIIEASVSFRPKGFTRVFFLSIWLSWKRSRTKRQTKQKKRILCEYENCKIHQSKLHPAISKTHEQRMWKGITDKINTGTIYVKQFLDDIMSKYGNITAAIGKDMDNGQDSVTKDLLATPSLLDLIV